MDALALRSAHPNQTQYAITRAKIGIFCTGEGKIDRLLVEDLNLPIDMQKDVPLSVDKFGESKSNYQLTLLYGQRLEPWVREPKQ